jgi:hypothetical protein
MYVLGHESNIWDDMLSQEVMMGDGWDSQCFLRRREGEIKKEEMNEERKEKDETNTQAES